MFTFLKNSKKSWGPVMLFMQELKRTLKDYVLFLERFERIFGFLGEISEDLRVFFLKNLRKSCPVLFWKRLEITLGTLSGNYFGKI